MHNFVVIENEVTKRNLLSRDYGDYLKRQITSQHCRIEGLKGGSGLCPSCAEKRKALGKQIGILQMAGKRRRSHNESCKVISN